jgi:hypothetical protein
LDRLFFVFVVISFLVGHIVYSPFDLFDLSDAQSDLTSAQTVFTSAQMNFTNAQIIFTSAQDDLTNAQMNLTFAQDDLTKAQSSDAINIKF